ncbi:hypothetical protein [Neobacillus sp. PS3-40]|uniref:hypothetical protein n=1 Tax=Neobacillus sp. PS3-40 TaxID=3070679 RepID=UPI0027E0033F|nr:hypothetical protein [Neobacillus sp. PS3-40]WML45412.1 hypothetical protein RCG20_05785 [Neobacillus sp. PS3-40]
MVKASGFYFEIYYNRQVEHDMFFEKYTDTIPFIADEFVWIYRKISAFEKWGIN